MCGIAGVIRFQRPGVAEEAPEGRIPDAWLDALDAPLARRGPDQAGRWRDRVMLESGVRVDVALVHRRLSIIDHETGAQPMVAGGAGYKGRTAVVFNGCIYNHRKLRTELTSAKHKFHTDHSDTEVLLHGYRHWGADMTQELEGMFAFAIWDARKGELFMARDRAGEKPLYGCNLPSGDGHAFASSVASLEAMLDEIESAAPRRIVAVTDWIARGASGSTPIEGIYEVPPARRARVREERGRPSITSRMYWEPPERSSGPARLTPELVDEMIARSVADRMEADVPVGVFLSGGVDSSLIAYHAQQHRAEHGAWVETFTVKMPDERYDESPWAQRVAEEIGAKHRTIPVKANAGEDLVTLIGLLGLPFADSSLLPTYWLSKAASKYVKVALSGDGADELFCGYERYVGAIALAKHGTLLRLLPKSFLPQRDPKSRWSKLARLIDAARHGGYDDLVATFSQRELARLIRRHRRQPTRKVEDPPLNDFENYLPHDLLRKVDTASMAFGLEVRSPYLSRELIELCLFEPTSSLMRKGERKGLLRQAAKLHLPAEIVDRPKYGFAVPVGEWFRSGFGGMKTLLMDQLTSAEPWPGIDVRIRKRAVRRMLREHESGGRDHSQRLYTLLVLSIWAHQTRGDTIVRVKPFSEEEQKAIDAIYERKPDAPRVEMRRPA